MSGRKTTVFDVCLFICMGYLIPLFDVLDMQLIIKGVMEGFWFMSDRYGRAFLGF